MDLNRHLSVISSLFFIIYQVIFALVFVLKYRKYQKQGGFVHIWKQNPGHFRVKIILIPIAVTVAYFVLHLIFVLVYILSAGIISMLYTLFSIAEITA